MDIATKRQYIVSERAHLMCPNMQFGILFTLNDNYNEEKVQKVIRQLCNAHSFLNCLIHQDENGNCYYDNQGNQLVSAVVLESRENFKEDYRKITSAGWDVRKEPLLKIFVYPKEQNCSFIFIAHHILCDGRGLLDLVNEFADAYVKEIAPVHSEEQLMKSMEDLPKGSKLPWISKCIVHNANQNWKKEKHKVNYEDYLVFEKDYLSKEHNQLRIEEKSEQEVAQYLELCHANQISLNDYLIAEMMINENTSKVLIAADIRKYLSIYHSGSLGNFSTAFGVVCKQIISDKIELAKEIKKRVQKHINSPQKLFLILACYFYMDSDLLDAVPISSLGTYNSPAGKFVGANMFGYKNRAGYSISNLGKLNNDAIIEATFIPPTSPANKVMQGVLTVNGRMKICTVRSET